MKRIGVRALLKRIMVFMAIFLFMVQPVQTKASKETNNETPKLLTIEYVIEEGLKNSYDILYYTHRWNMLNYQKEDTKGVLNGIEEPKLSSLQLLPVTREEFLAAYPNYNQLTEEEKQEIDRVIEIQIQINQSLNIILLQNHQSAKEQLKALEKEVAEKKRQLQQLIKEIDVEQDITKLNEKEIKESIQYYLTKLYIHILLYDEQIAFLEKEVQFLQGDVERVERFLKVDNASKEELKKIKYQLSRKEQELLNLKKSRQLLEKQLMIDLDIPLTQKVVFQAIDTSNLKKIEQPKDMKVLIENSFVYQKNKKNLEAANYKKEQASRNTEKQQMEQHVKMLEAQLNATAQKLKKFLVERYSYFESIYDKCQDLYGTYEQAQSDKEYYDKQLEIGLISQHEYQKSILELDEAMRDYRLAKLEYYLVEVEEKQFHKGYIPIEN